VIQEFNHRSLKELGWRESEEEFLLKRNSEKVRSCDAHSLETVDNFNTHLGKVATLRTLRLWIKTN
jgi:hypothetical protein